MTAEKNSTRNTINDVFGKLQEWLNGGLLWDQIGLYCTEMGFHFYPGCSLPSFEHSPQAGGASTNANAGATTSAAHHVTPVANPYQKAFENDTKSKRTEPCKDLGHAMVGHESHGGHEAHCM
jgi:hypothetical protein